MLTKEYDEIVTVLPDGQLQYLRVERIMEDGVQIAATNWRNVYTPDRDVEDLPPRAHHIAKPLWTPVVKEAYVRKRQEIEGAERAAQMDHDIAERERLERQLEILNAPSSTV